MKKISITFDVEPDLHTGDYKGVEKGIVLASKILEKYKIKATFFTTCDCIEKYPKIFQKLQKQGHEIALHGYRHQRFDDLNINEKEENIKKSLDCFKKYLKTNPIGFRSPQFSEDNEILDILQKYGFKYDSSYTPLNSLEFIFFPKRFLLILKHFFSKINPYKIRKNLYEIPTTSIIIPFSSIMFRIFPLFLLKLYLKIISLTHKNQVLYFHSWDFIHVKGSKIENTFPHTNLIKNFDRLISYSSKKFKYYTVQDLIK